MSEKTPRPKSRTLGDLLDEMAAARPKAEAVVFQGERLDYAGLKARADAFARALIAIGIGRGDRVALLVSNRPEWLVAAFAAAKLGAVTAAISTFSSPRELAFMLDHSGAKALVMLDAFRGRDFLGAVRAERARLPGLRTIVKLDGRPAAGFLTLPEFLERGRSVEPEALAAAQRAVRPEDIAFLLYTSGSTAAPKGVQLAHGPLIANGFDIGERMHLSASDRVWLAVPLFWSFGSANALPAIMTHRGTIVLQEGFDAGEAIALIEREHCSVYYGVGNMARALAEHPEHPGRRLGAMRTGLAIGPPEDIALTIAALGAEELCNVYGATETYGNCAVTDALDPLPLRLSTQGPPLPGMTIRAVDLLTRQPLPAGEVGELAVKGYVTPGYFRAPELDAGAFDNGGLVSDRRFRARRDGRPRALSRTAQRDDQDGRRQRLAARGRRGVAATPRHRRGLCRRPAGQREGRDRRGGGGIACGGGGRGGPDPRLLPRAARPIQGAGAPAISRGR